MPDDDDEVKFIVSRATDETEWHLVVKCESGLTDEEFAVALQSLADDILQGKVSFDGAPEASQHDAH